MILQRLDLTNFRSYKNHTFDFSPHRTIIIGPNTAGKTNAIEAITMLSTGRSFKTEKDIQLIHFGETFSRIQGKGEEDGEEITLEVIISQNGNSVPVKKYLVNGISRRRQDFASHLPTVLFCPEDLDIIIDGPSLRRHFLDEVLEQADQDYALATTAYSKALRQRNALLEHARETGRRIEKQFEYWDAEVIKHGQLITEKREEFIVFVNNSEKQIFDCNVVYDKSIISRERLDQYTQQEVAAAVTLVGPHRDDFVVEMFSNETQSVQDVKLFGSRGQQRLAIFQLRLLQIRFIKERLGKTPLLLLDDIFSELDERNILRILELTGSHQTIMTTTHKEFVPESVLQNTAVIELKK